MIRGNGIQRFALGGIGTRPWRVEQAERLSGAEAIAERVLVGARPTTQNRFKLALARRTLAAVLDQA